MVNICFPSVSLRSAHACPPADVPPSEKAQVVLTALAAFDTANEMDSRCSGLSPSGNIAVQFP